MSADRRDHSDHMAQHAIGETQKEWRSMARLAMTLRNGNVNPRWAEEKERLFTGIYRRLLTDPIDEVALECRRFKK